MLNRAVLQKLAMMRLNDARALLRARRYAGAYYIAGYVVECGLKSCIARQTRRFEFPDRKRTIESYTHDLNILVNLAGIDLRTRREKDEDFNKNWIVVSDWSEQSRYNTISRELARDLVRAIAEPHHGVLQWLQDHW